MHWRLVLSFGLMGCAQSRDGAGDKTPAPDPAWMDSGTAAPADPVDRDADGTEDAADCAPDDPAIHPGATEVCNGLDDNCDGAVDEGLMFTVHADDDGDGFGDASTERQVCAEDAGWVSDASDCDDTRADVHPGRVDDCDAVDNDCDDAVDEDGWVDVWFDADGDGWGDDTVGAARCPDVLWVERDGDCDDANPDVHPDATEVCNTIDDDCDGVADSSAVCPCDVEHWPDALHPYLFCTAVSDWQDAADACDALGYALVTFDSAAEGTWVETVIFTYPDNYWWIGFTDAATEGAWGWVDGSPVTYENWASLEPNNGHGHECVADSQEDCAMLKWSGAAWNDYPCGCDWPSSVCEGASEYRPQ